MRAAIAWTIVGLLAGAVFAQTSPPLAGAQPVGRSEEDVLAADSLLNSAVAMTCSPSSTLARAGRLVALCRLADRLAPGDYHTNSLLADIHLAQADPPREAHALANCLAVYPRDYAHGLRWLAAQTQQINDAAGREKLLKSLADRVDLYDDLRAEAETWRARIFQGQGRADEALQALRHALQLDAFCPGALSLQSVLEPAPEPGETLARGLRMVRGDCRSWAVAWQIGLELGRLGLHDQALRFMRHAWTLDRQAAGAEPPSQTALVQYCNALLDANLPAEVIATTEPLLGKFTETMDTRSLLIEAYRGIGQPKKAEQVVLDMDTEYRRRQALGDNSSAIDGEMAWFHLVTLPRPSTAVLEAQRAHVANRDSAVYQRILGKAQLDTGSKSSGRGLLENLLGKDTYASVFLAEHYRAEAQPAKADKAILAAAPLSRTGPAWRQLAALARKRGVKIPPAEGSEQVQRILKDFDPSYLDMVTAPDKYIGVSLRARPARAECGEPLEIVATLTNIAGIDIPLGERGLMRPTMALTVTITEEGAKQGVAFTDVPMVVWPAPRYLGPGKSVTRQVRLDVASVASYLQARPLTNLRLTATGSLDPQSGKGVPLANIRIQPATIERQDVLGPFDRRDPAQWVNAYGVALGRMVGFIRRGKTAERMRAARQIASLLDLARETERGQTRPPEPLAKTIDKLVLESMMAAVLKDRSPVVRQEMISALQEVSLDDTMLALLGPAISDPSPMVRCRVVETLAATRSRGNDTIVKLLARDGDELVRAMAEAFRKR